MLLLLWKSPVPIYTQISNIGIPHICQAVTIGNTLTSIMEMAAKAEYVRSGAVLAIR